MERMTPKAEKLDELLDGKLSKFIYEVGLVASALAKGKATRNDVIDLYTGILSLIGINPDELTEDTVIVRPDNNNKYTLTMTLGEWFILCNLMAIGMKSLDTFCSVEDADEEVA